MRPTNLLALSAEGGREGREKPERVFGSRPIGKFLKKKKGPRENHCMCRLLLGLPVRQCARYDIYELPPRAKDPNNSSVRTPYLGVCCTRTAFESCTPLLRQKRGEMKNHFARAGSGAVCSSLLLVLSGRARVFLTTGSRARHAARDRRSFRSTLTLTRRVRDHILWPWCETTNRQNERTVDSREARVLRTQNAAGWLLNHHARMKCSTTSARTTARRERQPLSW